ncbi:porin family protein [Gramella sp. AN32]|uniref:Porin family protein n=1 Tax=Christiangramia antarctica TaxID=2058158 RepID=A0ABW5X7B6_9FLAO|nr:porin family protein [Gramella sp. AN32]
MTRNLIALIFMLMPILSFSQDEERHYEISDSIPFTIDSLYREDQFYIGFSFNLVTNLPKEVSQESFSGGIHVGFIRDFPLNERRNIALGIGAGWSINSYGQNLAIQKGENGETSFSSLENLNYTTNRFTTQLLEMPIEFRWRTSTPETYKFWRIYTGFRLGYMYNFRSNYKNGSTQIILNDIPELNRFRLGTTFTFGYNTFNFQFYYALNPFFKDAFLNEKPIDMTTLQIGLNFYIL